MIDDALESLVLELELSVWRAVVQKNGAALTALLADEYVEITIDGQRVEKAGVVSESPKIDEIDDFGIQSEKVIFVGEGCAVLTYHLTLEGTCRGVTISPRDRWATSVWSRRTGSWRCYLFQQSRFASAMST